MASEKKLHSIKKRKGKKLHRSSLALPTSFFSTATKPTYTIQFLCLGLVFICSMRSHSLDFRSGEHFIFSQRCWRIKWLICCRDIWGTMLEGSTKKPSRSVSGEVINFFLFFLIYSLLLFTGLLFTQFCLYIGLCYHFVLWLCIWSRIPSPICLYILWIKVCPVILLHLLY